MHKALHVLFISCDAALAADIRASVEDRITGAGMQQVQGRNVPHGNPPSCGLMFKGTSEQFAAAYNSLFDEPLVRHAANMEDVGGLWMVTPGGVNGITMSEYVSAFHV